MQNKPVFENLVQGGLPLWLEIVSVVPERRERGRLLELGSPPFHITLLMQKFHNYDLTLTAAAADGRPRIEQTVVSKAYGEEHRFDCVCFDLEHDRFPFPDNAFDVVMWCEVIEHLTENPVLALREIHRVLKPGGALVISTPNVARVENILRLCVGVNIYDPYHLGAPLRGSRHSREYTLADLTDLLTGCGFRVDMAQGRELGQEPLVRIRRALLALVRFALQWAPGVHASHLFVRAVKEGPFRWAFPPTIFDTGHLLWYLHVCDREVIMGRNDIPHTMLGWGPTDTGVEGKVQRRAGDEAHAFLVSSQPFARAVLEVAGTEALTAVEVQAFQGADATLRQLGTVRSDVPAGRWSRLEVPLQSPQVGERVHLRILAPKGLHVHRMALEP